MMEAEVLMGEPAIRNMPMTFEEAAKLDPDKYPGELDAGRWVPMTNGTWRHGRVVVNTASLLKLHARRIGGLSVAAADPGTKLARNPDVLRGPDVGVIASCREPTGKGVDGWLEGAPDLAVEIVGDSQTVGELFKKALEYLAAGGKQVWVVDPDSERVVVVDPPNQFRVLGRDDTLDGGAALPGFSCLVSELFE